MKSPVRALLLALAILAACTSTALAQVVSQGVVTATVASSPNPSPGGGDVTFTATVVPGSGSTATPTGSIRFRVDGTDLGSPVALGAGGTAELTTSALSGGVHQVAVVYSGDESFFGAKSPPLSQTVLKRASATALASPVNPSPGGATVTVTATVTPAAGAGTPAGSVQFRDGATAVGAPVALVAGVATGTISGLAVGSHDITAVYAGDVSFDASTSAVLTHVVSAVAPPPPPPPPATCHGTTKFIVHLRSQRVRKPGLQVSGPLAGARITRARLTGPAGFRALALRHGRASVYVDLRGLEKGSYVLKVEVRLRGRTQKLSRTYRVCGG